MIFLNASGGGAPQSEKWLCEQPSNHNYTQMRLREGGNVGIFLVDQDQPFLILTSFSECTTKVIQLIHHCC